MNECKKEERKWSRKIKRGKELKNKIKEEILTKRRSIYLSIEIDRYIDR